MVRVAVTKEDMSNLQEGLTKRQQSTVNALAALVYKQIMAEHAASVIPQVVPESTTTTIVEKAAAPITGKGLEVTKVNVVAAPVYKEDSSEDEEVLVGPPSRYGRKMILADSRGAPIKINPFGNMHPEVKPVEISTAAQPKLGQRREPAARVPTKRR